MQIQAVADHVWIERSTMAKQTKAGIVMPDSVIKERPCQHGVIVAVGPDCKQVSEGEIAFFDEAESRQVLIESTREAYTVIPEECIYGVTSKAVARAAGMVA